MHRVVHQSFVGALEAGDVAHQADAAQETHILVGLGMRAEIVPEIGAIVPSQAKIENEVAAMVADGAERRASLAITGGGTRAGLGRRVRARTTLSTNALSGVTLYEPAELVLSARAGTPLAEIEALLAQRSQRLAFEPMDHRPLLGEGGEPTIGGVVAANVSGPRRIQDWLDKRGKLPEETQHYVKTITGRPAETWKSRVKGKLAAVLPREAPCQERVTLIAAKAVGTSVRRTVAAAKTLAIIAGRAGAREAPPGAGRAAGASVQWRRHRRHPPVTEACAAGGAG